MTFNAVCETDASAGRATATRRGVGRVCHLDARLLWLQQLCAEGVMESRFQAWRAQRGRPGKKDCRFEANDLAFERNTPSTANVLELLDGGSEFARGCRGKKDCRVLIWNVRNVCETRGWFWIFVGMVIVILMVLSGGPFANPIGQMTEVGRRRPTRMLRNYVQWKMSSSIMRRCPDPDSVWNLIACDAELWIRDLQESSRRQRGPSCLCGEKDYSCTCKSIKNRSAKKKLTEKIFQSL